MRFARSRLGLLPHLLHQPRRWCAREKIDPLGARYFSRAAGGVAMARRSLLFGAVLQIFGNQSGARFVHVPGGRSMSGKRSIKIDAVTLFPVFALILLVGLLLQGCTAFNPQGTAIQQAPNYYNKDYSQLSPEEKMQLEDHLANQSNSAWRTSAAVASGAGQLGQGTGFLLGAIKY
jgi:hypothetical protein